ncbi:aminoglycoside phosphotransferase family protein [Kitasatospora sp. NPDC047058]|uniref:phosphotransferase family protein n=1 Tax=Kitasatospora sp. NPDC047058 TaxID=3155620 RepID=UPI0033E84122
MNPNHTPPEDTATAGTAALTASAREALVTACAAQGFDPRGARLLHRNHHWVLRLPSASPGGPVIAKVHHSSAARAAVTRQVLTAQWLHEGGILTARPAGTRFPVLAAGHLVTFTHDLGDGGRISSEELAPLLARLHALPVPGHLDLPRLDPATSLLTRIERLPDHVLGPADRHWLTGHARALGDLFTGTNWPGRPVVLHGDLATQNTLRSKAGPALIDLEYVSIGPAHYDLAFPAWTRDGFGGDPENYRQFCAAYGTDVTTVDGGEPYARVLAPLRAAVGVVIALEAAVRAPDWADEAAHRLACARGQGGPRFAYPWHWSSAIGYTKPPATSVA